MELQDIDLKELIENETGERFDRQGYIKCPFHGEKTPSLSIKFHSDKNKWKFKCFGCGTSGDAIDFISNLKGIDFVESKKYLGLSVEKSKNEMLEEKVQGYIQWELSKFRAGQELLGVFTFTSKEGEPLYYKAKFKKPDGTKCLAYYHIEEDKVISGRGTDEVPYNLSNTWNAMRQDSIIVITEGEKDSNTINSLLKKDGYAATSVKGCKDIEILANSKIFVCGDTGKAGEKYKWEVYHKLFKSSRSFKFINLPGIKDLGENKDITDWIEAGHTKQDLLNAFNRSLDLKSKCELQQDGGGIYKLVYNKKFEEHEKVYITNFKLLDAKRIIFVDEEQEGIKLIIKSPTGVKIEKAGPSTVFDDIRTFKNFLGTIDLAFTGRIETLTDLKIWINKYFALEVEEIHQGVKFISKDDQLILVTSEGALSKDKAISSIKADSTNSTTVLDTESATKEELLEIKKHLFKFATPEKTISIIGTVINNLAVYQNQALKEKLHHLLIVGESGCGKSTILENVIAPMLNYPKRDIKSIGLITPFALIKGGSDGNYPMLFDEFKPSSLDKYKIAKLSEIFRNLYDRATISRGDKSFRSKDFQLQRPLILVGEESYPNGEKALIERSCIVYLSKRERTVDHTKSMNWIIENEFLLNKLGRSLVDIILNLGTEEYKQIRGKVASEIRDINNRPLCTAINICSGIEILNILFKKTGIKEIKNYTGHVVENIKTEVLEEGQETHSIVEQMLILYNTMIEDGRAYDVEGVVRLRGDGIYIKTSEMINQIREHVNKVGADIIPLNLKDFKKQATKAGYLTGIANKVLKVGTKTVRFDTYNKELLRALRVDSIAPPEMMECTEEESKVVPFKQEGNA